MFLSKARVEHDVHVMALVVSAVATKFPTRNSL